MLPSKTLSHGPRRFARFATRVVPVTCLLALACERPVTRASAGDSGNHPESVGQPVGPGASAEPASSQAGDSGAPSPVLLGTSFNTPLQEEPSPARESSSQHATQVTSQAAPLPESRYLIEMGAPPSGRKAMSERFSHMQPWSCRSELRKRKVAVRPVNVRAPGVAVPLRLAGNIGTVQFVTPGANSVYGILDCRLVLLLSELEPTLLALSVKAVYVDNIYRPKAHLAGKKTPSQHAFGLAIDIAGFGMKDGTRLNVERDFHGTIGAPVCGPNAALSEKTRESILLRNIVCELTRLGAFNYLLTPNHDEAHRNHVHGDINGKSHDHVVR